MENADQKSYHKKAEMIWVWQGVFVEDHWVLYTQIRQDWDQEESEHHRKNEFYTAPEVVISADVVLPIT